MSGGLGQDVRAFYVRVPIRNDSGRAARGCSAVLYTVERRDAQGQWIPLPYNDTLTMAWANKPNPTVDIHAGGSDTLDVVYARDGLNAMQLAMRGAGAYLGLLQAPGEYRLTFKVNYDDTGRLRLILRIHWGGAAETMGFPDQPIANGPAPRLPDDD
jgi:hypothetical protein